ncbi:MAG: hypothetical protein JSV92_04505 [archaeon]|nr:MAG: hypothetical protein JSV92_04505 [archaeon]
MAKEKGKRKPMGKWRRIIIASIIFMVIAQAVHTLGSFATMDFYTNPEYFHLWSEIMMPTGGAPGMEFFAVSVLFNFITALILTLFYVLINKSVPGKFSFMKGINYGILLFIITAVPTFFSMSLLLAVPVLLSISWMIEALIIDILGGIVIARFIK